MDFLSIVNAVLMMSIFMMIGVLLTKKVRFQQDTKNLMIFLIVNVAVPSLIISSFSELTIEKSFYHRLLFVFGFAVILYIVGISIGMLITRLINGSVQKGKEIAITSAQANTGFIGLPLCASLFGPEAVLLAVVFDVGTGISMWTFSAIVLQKKLSLDWKTIKKIINLPLIAFAIGLTLHFLHIELPSYFLQQTKNLGLLASPLAMMYIGCFIPQLLKQKKIKEPSLLAVASCIRLFLIPLLTASVLHFLSLDQDTTHVILIMSMMPVGAMVPILFSMHGADEEFGASATVYSTILSLLTIPIMAYIGQYLVGVH